MVYTPALANAPDATPADAPALADTIERAAVNARALVVHATPCVRDPAPGGDGPDTAPPTGAPAASAHPMISQLAEATAAALAARLAPWLERCAVALERRAEAPPAPVAEPPILLSADEARAHCGGLAKSTWADFDTRGVIPAPVRVGGRVFWRRTDLALWAAHGCPNRVRFGAIRDTAEAPPPAKNRTKN